MKKASRSIWIAPFLGILGCASSPPPAAKPAPTETPKVEMVGVYGQIPEDKPANAEENTPPPANPPPAPPPPPAPAIFNKVVVNDLIDPPVSPAFDAVATSMQKKDWARASSALQKILPSIDEKGLLHEKAAAHALAGRIADQLKNAKKADAEYEIVLAMGKDPKAISMAIEASEAAEDDKRLRQQVAAYAVGEAQFYFAEKRRREADALKMPKYQGSGEKDEVLAFINEKITTWIKTKRPKIETAQQEYSKILTHYPAPHPRWVIAGANRVGQMWSNFVDDFRNTPIPKAWLAEGKVPGTDLTYAELRTEYRAKIDEASMPQLEMARQSFRVCTNYASKFKIENDDSKTCQAWLDAHPATN